MKKAILSCLVVGSLLLTTGCGKEKVMVCKRDAEIEEGVNLSLNYKVTYKGDDVELIESTEKVTSDDKDYLEDYKDRVEKIYSPYKDVKYYDYEVTIDGDVLTSSTKIDYSKIDTEELIKIDSANKEAFKDGKLKLASIKATYKSIGASCEDE